jgi:hypothetical protein
MAAEYIARRFGEYGLEAPAGSYLQPFPIIGTTPEPSSVSLSFTGPDGSVRPTYLDDFVLSAGDPVAAGAQGEAELVFVGYGINAPETGWDDFAGTDVTGKYVMILVNDPPAPPTEPDLFGGVAMTDYGRWTYKYEEAARQGALGALVVHETGPAGYPWSVVRGGFSGEQFALPPDPAGPPPPAFLGWVSLDLATAVLAAGGHDFDDLKARAGTRGFTHARDHARQPWMTLGKLAQELRGATRKQELELFAIGASKLARRREVTHAHGALALRGHRPNVARRSKSSTCKRAWRVRALRPTFLDSVTPAP